MDAARTLVADVLAIPAEFEFEGKTYRLAPIDTLDVSAHLERWALRRANSTVDSMKPNLDDLTEMTQVEDMLAYQQARAKLDQAIWAGHFRYGEQGFDEAIGTAAGSIESVFRCLQVHQPDVTRDIVKRIKANPAKWNEVIKTLNELNDPNRQRPAMGS